MVFTNACLIAIDSNVKAKLASIQRSWQFDRSRAAQQKQIAPDQRACPLTCSPPRPDPIALVDVTSKIVIHSFLDERDISELSDAFRHNQ
jgi:hypothetical protein